MVFVIAPSILSIQEIESSLKFLDHYDSPESRQIIIMLFLVCATSLLYYVIPNVKQKITKTFPGAILTVFLWFQIQKLFSYYLDNFHQFNFIYGGLAGIMIYLMFFYLVNLIFIFGAQFNYHLYRVYKIFLRN